MADIHVRRAGPFDAGAMARLLNEIIQEGGTTALREPVSGDILRDWMAHVDVWHVAEISGEILGFQWIGGRAHLPPDACDIATFVSTGQHGLGIGSRLFAATRIAAKAKGYAWINATIRADNDGGRAYYRSRGFELYARTREDGFEKVKKRYNL